MATLFKSDNVGNAVFYNPLLALTAIKLSQQHRITIENRQLDLRSTADCITIPPQTQRSEKRYFVNCRAKASYNARFEDFLSNLP